MINDYYKFFTLIINNASIIDQRPITPQNAIKNCFIAFLTLNEKNLHKKKTN